MKTITPDTIDWMQVSKHHWKDNQNRIIDIVRRMQWDSDFKGKQYPMMPALGIKNAIEELKIPNVSAIAISNELAPFGLYGIEAHYKNVDVRIYIVDEGCSIQTLCVEIWNK